MNGKRSNKLEMGGFAELKPSFLFLSTTTN
jgi:hypothetical protein